MRGSSSPDFSPCSQKVESSELHEAIRRRAEEIYVRSGRIPGHDLENWAQAEAEIVRELGRPPRRKAVVVDVDGVQYVGEYRSDACDDYQPGEFEVGEDAAVRFEGEKMFVERPNGRELETIIIHKIG